MSANETGKETSDKEKREDGTYVDKPSEESSKSVRAGEFITDESHKNKCKPWKPSVALMWVYKRIILIFICTVVAVSFTVPIIIYGVDADRRSDGLGGDNATMLFDLDLDNCIETADVQVG